MVLNWFWNLSVPPSQNDLDGPDAVPLVDLMQAT